VLEVSTTAAAPRHVSPAIVCGCYSIGDGAVPHRRCMNLLSLPDTWLLRTQCVAAEGWVLCHYPCTHKKVFTAAPRAQLLLVMPSRHACSVSVGWFEFTHAVCLRVWVVPVVASAGVMICYDCCPPWHAAALISATLRPPLCGYPCQAELAGWDLWVL
jgi:hypothetical protein